MTRLAVFALLLSANALPAAPVPKEFGAMPTHIGKWQNVDVDSKNPGVIQSRGQFWYFDEDGGFTYQDQTAVESAPETIGAGMVFDPKTGHMQHSMIAPDEKIRLGFYKIDGERLTLNLNVGPGSPRPKGLEPQSNSSIWHLQRVEEKK